MRALEIGELATFARVVGKLIVGEESAGDDVGSHGIPRPVGCARTN
jgi:hypothetical protein